MKINKKALDILMNILSALILLSGWILYVGASIARDREAAKVLKNSSRSVMDSVPAVNEASRDGTTIMEREDQYIEYIDRLINENKALTDSLYYYMLYYRLAAGRIDDEYVFEKKRQAMDMNTSGN